MRNQNKFPSSVRFFGASSMFFIALLSFVTALNYRGPENNFLADNWEVPLVVFFILAFVLGWWIEGFVEQMLMNRGRQMALFVCVVFLLLYGLLAGGSLVSSEFTGHALRACGFILLSGFFYRMSVMSPEVVTKFRSRE